MQMQCKHMLNYIQMRVETKMVMVMVDYEIEGWRMNSQQYNNRKRNKNTQFDISLYHILMRSVGGVQLSVISGLFLCLWGQI